jgi:hypothetical protein
MGFQITSPISSRSFKITGIFIDLFTDYEPKTLVTSLFIFSLRLSRVLPLNN